MRDDIGRGDVGDPPVRSAGTADEAAGSSRASRDLAGIFATAGNPRTGPGVVDPVTPIVTRKPARSPRTTSKAPILVSLGAAIGAFAVWTMLPSRTVVSLASARAIEHPRQLAMAEPQPPEPQQPVPVAPVAVRGPAVPFPGTVAGVETVSERVAPPKRAALVKAAYHPSQRLAQRRSKRLAVASRDRDPCGRMRRLWLARCMRPQVLAADRQLRQAYAKAVRAGVDRDMLVSYRNRWNRVRGDAVYDPAYVTATFHDMAERLDAASYRADY